jgi:hypothetical protein
MRSSDPKLCTVLSRWRNAEVSDHFGAPGNPVVRQKIREVIPSRADFQGGRPR